MISDFDPDSVACDLFDRHRRGYQPTAAGLALLSSSCAYYNTYYLARKYYTTATEGSPYPVEKPTGAQRP